MSILNREIHQYRLTHQGVIVMRTSNLFSNREVREVLEGCRQGLKNEIDGFDKNYILNVSLHDLAEHLISKYKLDVPILQEDQKQVISEGEVVREIPDYGEIRQVKMQSITMAIPFIGDPNLFGIRPSSFYSSGWLLDKPWVTNYTYHLQRQMANTKL